MWRSVPSVNQSCKYDYVMLMLLHSLYRNCRLPTQIISMLSIKVFCYMFWCFLYFFFIAYCAAFSKVTVVALREWFVITLVVVIFACTSLQQLQCRSVWFLFAADWITHSFQYVSLPETITRRFHYTRFPLCRVYTSATSCAQLDACCGQQVALV